MESKGSPHYCWRTAWIKVDKKNNKAEKAEKKASMKKRSDNNQPIGLLAYSNGEPMRKRRGRSTWKLIRQTLTRPVIGLWILRQHLKKLGLSSLKRQAQGIMLC